MHQLRSEFAAESPRVVRLVHYGVDPSALHGASKRRGCCRGGRAVAGVMALGAVIGTASDFASSADDSQAVAESSSTLDSNLARHVACGPAAAGYVLRIVGAPVRGHELAELSDERGETSLEEIRSFLAARGLAVEPRIMEAVELRSWPGIAIVHVSQ